MARIIVISIMVILSLSAVWFYQKMATPQLNSQVKVHNLPWQITVVDSDTLHVLDLDIGKSTFGDAITAYGDEFKLAWFEHEEGVEQKGISLEAYFSRVSLSGLRAKIILELEYDPQEITLDYLKRNSGKPEVLASRSIKYPLDDLAKKMQNQRIKSLTYVPTVSIPMDIIKSRFGIAQETISINELVEFWLYPQKGLVIMFDQKGKEAFQYVPTSDFQRLETKVRLNQKFNSKNRPEE